MTVRASEILTVVPFGPSLFYVGGELDMTTAPRFLSATAGAAGHGGPITLEVSGLEFCDVVGIRAIDELSRSLPSGCVTLHGPQRVVRRVLEVLGSELSRVHVNACTHDPYPHDDGRPFLDEDLSRSLAEMKRRYATLAATSVRLRAETSELIERCAGTLDSSRTLRVRRRYRPAA